MNNPTDTNKPYSHTGEKGTETNQASEDELRFKVGMQLAKSRVPGYKQTKGEWNEEARYSSQSVYADNILKLIRTEKLKLLAAVRERVVGEDNERLSGNRAIKHEWNGRNELRAEQRTTLNKLEAEL